MQTKTPKQEAKDLINSFYRIGLNQREEAVDSALLCVINILSVNPHSNPLNTQVKSTFYYWLEVKNEIENYDR